MLGVSSMAKDNKTLRLGDGRTLGYAVYGSAEGKALFYFHGHPGSRSEARFLAQAAVQQGIRLIGIDRPGLGLSTYQAGRCILDWPEDVVQLADALQTERFAVVGFSGGGPYAAACAYSIPDRLLACGIVSGVGHISRFLAFLSQWLPRLLIPVTRRFFQDETHAQANLVRFAGQWPEPDRKSLLQPGIKDIMAASLVEALRPGARGAAYDGMLLGRAWGFNIEAIGFPAVYLWHGELDKEIPIATARALAQSIPQCKTTFYPGEGHISVIVNHGEEIVTTLMG